MRATVTIDDKLFTAAQEFLGVKEASALVREALTALIQREAARRLIELGGSEPDAEYPRRRRPFAE